MGYDLVIGKGDKVARNIIVSATMARAMKKERTTIKHFVIANYQPIINAIIKPAYQVLKTKIQAIKWYVATRNINAYSVVTAYTNANTIECHCCNQFFNCVQIVCVVFNLDKRH